MEDFQSNITELRKIVNEKMFDREEAIEFMDAIESNVNDYEKEIRELRDEVDDKEDLDEFDDESKCDNVIDCGIGVIEYKEPDNLVLQSIMESLEERIKEFGALKVMKFMEVAREGVHF